MSKKAVEIICILDRSGSMSGLQNEVINSFNQFLDEQKAEKGKAKLTLVLFDDHYDVVHEGVDIQKVPELTNKVYFARGMTALNDAVGKTIKTAKDNIKKAICLIQTDGLENASQEYKASEIKKLVEEKTKLGWEFVFLGANIDAFEEGAKFGVMAESTMQFDPTAKGVAASVSYMSNSTRDYRKNN